MIISRPHNACSQQPCSYRVALALAVHVLAVPHLAQPQADTCPNTSRSSSGGASKSMRVYTQHASACTCSPLINGRCLCNIQLLILCMCKESYSLTQACLFEAVHDGHTDFQDDPVTPHAAVTPGVKAQAGRHISTHVIPPRVCQVAHNLCVCIPTCKHIKHNNTHFIVLQHTAENTS